MYGKSFASMYVGSMRGAGVHVFAVWNYCIANCDSKGEIEFNHDLVAFILGCDRAQVDKAIDFLTSPDPNSRSKDEEGRRMVRVGQFSYKLVNHEHYQAMRTNEERREYFRNWKRAKRSGVDKCGQSGQSTDSTHIDIDVDIDKDKKIYSPSFNKLWASYPDKSGKDKAYRAYKKYIKAGDTDDEISIGIQRYIADVTERRKKFKDLNFKNGATFFSQRVWKDYESVDSTVVVNQRSKRYE